ALMPAVLFPCLFVVHGLAPFALVPTMLIALPGTIFLLLDISTIYRDSHHGKPRAGRGWGELAGQPPMADMGRDGCRKPGSLMPWPGSFAATACRQIVASSSSLAPARIGSRRLLSVRANRQLRTWPSAVSRTRSHAPQNGLVT